MDPITHTLTGAALARAGLGRATPLAGAALVLAANAPDVDVLAYLGGEYEALAFRRGWTHGPLALVVLPFVVAGALLVWDRWVRRRRDPGAAPARAGPLVAVSLAGVATHPALDWLNTYGIRLLMPFRDRWFYGDALFIVDPWVWLLLGGSLFLAAAPRRWGLLPWLGLAVLLSLPVLGTGFLPTAARAAWLAGLAVLAVLRALGTGERRGGAAARVGLGAAAVYILVMVAASRAAEARAREAFEAAGISPVTEVMFAPAPADPFSGELVAVTPEAYHRGWFRWLREPMVLLEGAPVPVGGDGPALEAALEAEAARDFLTWSRFPFFRVEPEQGGPVVFIGDARYAGEGRAGSLAGVTIRPAGAGEAEP